MAKSNDGSWLMWLIIAGLGYLFLKPNATGTATAAAAQQSAAVAEADYQSMIREGQGGPTGVMTRGDSRPIFLGPPIKVGPDDLTYDPYQSPPIIRLPPEPIIPREITLPYDQVPPTPPKGWQWWTPPTGVPPMFVTWYLEPVGTVHKDVDPREVLGTNGAGWQDTQPQRYPPDALM